jgi:hypothetical protein
VRPACPDRQLGREAVKVLFLDIDGVLNTHDFCGRAVCGPIHRDKVFRLNTVLFATGARVVISSAWRYIVHRGEANLKGFDWLLRSHGLWEGRVIGITRPDTMINRDPHWDGSTPWPQANERGEQIADWIRLAPGQVGVPVDQYAVVDDLDLGISAAGHPFVKTDGERGLTEADADRLIELLGPAHDDIARRPALDHLERPGIADRRVEHGERA